MAADGIARHMREQIPGTSNVAEREAAMNPAGMISRMLPRSLRARLILLVFIAVIPAVALLLFTARDQRRMAEAHAETDLRRLAEIVNNEHRFLIEGSRQLLTVLAELPAVKDQNTQACNMTMQRIADNYPQYVGLGAIKPSGERFCGGNFVDAGPVNVSDRAWFKQTLKTGNFTIGHYQIGRLAKRAVLPLAYPARGESGDVRAVLLAVVDLDWLKAFLARTMFLEKASVAVIDDKGVILAHHPEIHWLGFSIRGTGPERAIRSGRRGLHTVEWIDGVQRLAVLSSFSRDGESGALHLVLSTPRAEVYAGADQGLRRNLFWLGFVFLTVAGAAWFGGGVFVVRPILTLLQAAKRIAGGDLKARIESVDGSGELGALARSFNAMAASLQAREEATRRAEAKARENERLAAMGATVAGITHEIANPLSGMHASVQLLELDLAQAGPKNEEEIRTVLGDLKNEIERLRALLQDLRFLGRPARLDRRPVAVGDIVADILKLQAHDCRERGVGIETEFPESLPAVSADREKLKQALLNLCKNAVEAMPDGGQLRLVGYAERSQVVVKISDTGMGIPSDVDVFELFTTTKSSGLGLGLAIARQIIAAHGGVISYESESGGGTTFTVSLPVSSATE